MKIGILHLSDLHIENDAYLDKVQMITEACAYEIQNISALYITVTGDITKFGRIKEFETAKFFLDKLKEQIKPKNGILPIEIILVPGNHDCCFDEVNSTRKIIVDSFRKSDKIDNVDFYNAALSVQDNYWSFYQNYIGNTPDNKIAFKRIFTPRIDKKIVFHCYNSSWMSDIEESVGDLLIPENNFIQNENGELIISLFHHPCNWISPNTPPIITKQDLKTI
jgi:predicted MPP superfamily phosphohydrolase